MNIFQFSAKVCQNKMSSQKKINKIHINVLMKMVDRIILIRVISLGVVVQGKIRSRRGIRKIKLSNWKKFKEINQKIINKKVIMSKTAINQVQTLRLLLN